MIVDGARRIASWARVSQDRSGGIYSARHRVCYSMGAACACAGEEEAVDRGAGAGSPDADLAGVPAIPYDVPPVDRR